MNSPAPEPNLIELFVRPIHESGIRYLIAGSVGSMHYSEPRLTLHIDIPLFITKKDIVTILNSFSEPEFYCPPADIIASEIARDSRGHFNLIHIPSGLKADLYPGNRDATFAWAWENRLTEILSEREIYIAPIEYIILWKMIYYKEGKSEKHLRDIQRILDINSNLCEMEFLNHYIAEFSLQNVWSNFNKEFQ